MAANGPVNGSGRPGGIGRWLPILTWGRSYGRDTLTSDLIAAVIVTIMLIPQSLAYALLAGLPPEMGLYASILPLVAYALFGTSRTLAVGPVAVVSLLTAAAVEKVATQGSAEYAVAAIVLAVLSGLFLLLLGVLRLGFIANFPEPPRDRRLHHGLWHHCDQPAQAPPGRSGERRQPDRNRRFAGRAFAGPARSPS